MLVSGPIGKPSPRSTASPHNEGPLMVIVTWAGPTAPSRQPDPPGSQSWGQAPRHRSEKRIRFGSLVGDLLGSQALRVVPAVVTDFGQSSERLTGSVLLAEAPGWSDTP